MADARTYADLMLAEPPSEDTAFARSHLADASMEQAQRDEANVCSQTRVRANARATAPTTSIAAVDSASAGDPAAALENFLACGRVLALRGGADTPTMFPWRSQAAHALIQLNDRQRALDLAEEELELATTGQVPGAIGAALITLGLLEGGDDGLHRLRCALDASCRAHRAC